MWGLVLARFFDGFSSLGRWFLLLYVERFFGCLCSFLFFGQCGKKEISSRKEFDSLKVEGILHNWEASLLCALSKDRRVLHCTPPPVVTLKLNIGGVTRGKLGPAGILGVPCIGNWSVLVYFSKACWCDGFK